MRLGITRRGRFWVWCWAVGFALICSYIAFDILDIDGSELHKRFDSGMVTATIGQADAEKLFRLELSPSEPWAGQLFGAGGSLIADAFRTRIEPSRGLSVMRHGPLLPRRVLPQLSAATGTASPDSDPA